MNDHGETSDAATDPTFFIGLRGIFPIGRELGEEIGACWVGFVHFFLSAIAVESESRGGDESRRVFKLKKLLNEELGGGDTAFAEALFLLGRPTTCDVLTGEVDDRMAIGEILGILET